MDSNSLLIYATQASLFALRVALVVRVAAVGTAASAAIAAIGVVALVTTCRAWIEGRADVTWRGCFVGVSYLVVCVMQPGALSGTLGVAFWSLVAVQLAAKLALGRRCTVTGPVFVSVVDRWPYSVVRHPMTAAEWAIAAVLLASNATAWNAVAFGFVSVANIVAIRWEESFLSARESYREYASRCAWRVVPGVW